jgi:hypothetical protein
LWRINGVGIAVEAGAALALRCKDLFKFAVVDGVDTDVRVSTIIRSLQGMGMRNVDLQQ